MTTLGDLLGRVDALDAELTIYAERPWSSGSRADVRPHPQDGSTAKTADGLSYFLEVAVVRDDVAAYVDSAKLVDSAIHYAEHDALPR